MGCRFIHQQQKVCFLYILFSSLSPHSWPNRVLFSQIILHMFTLVSSWIEMFMGMHVNMHTPREIISLLNNLYTIWYDQKTKIQKRKSLSSDTFISSPWISLMNAEVSPSVPLPSSIFHSSSVCGSQESQGLHLSQEILWGTHMGH